MVGLADPTALAKVDVSPFAEGARDIDLDVIRREIKSLEMEIEAQRTARELNESAARDRRAYELADVSNQLKVMQDALAVERRREATLTEKIVEASAAPRPSVVVEPAPSEVAAEIEQQNAALAEELAKLKQSIADETGVSDLDALLQSGSGRAARIDELQRLKLQVRQPRGAPVAQKQIARVVERVATELDDLTIHRGKLVASTEKLRSKIGEVREKVEALEVQARALRMMDVLLAEKLKHDDLLLKVLRERDPGEAPPRPAPVCDRAFVSQLRNQVELIRALDTKLLGLEAVAGTADKSELHLVERLRGLARRCHLLVDHIVEGAGEEIGRLR